MVNWLQSSLMELLLNLAWLALAVATLSAFLRRRHSSSWTAQIPCVTALLAIGCVLVLLFPVVSASDDLHPTQAVLEDATKRLHQLTAPLQQMQSHAPSGLLPAFLVVSLLCVLSVVHRLQPQGETARVIGRERIPLAGRAPPPFLARSSQR